MILEYFPPSTTAAPAANGYIQIVNSVVAGSLVAGLGAVWKWLSTMNHRLDKLEETIRESLIEHTRIREQINHLHPKGEGGGYNPYNGPG